MCSVFIEAGGVKKRQSLIVVLGFGLVTVEERPKVMTRRVQISVVMA